MPRAYSKLLTGSNTKSRSDSSPLEPFTHVDRISRSVPHLTPIQQDGLYSEQIRELRQLHHVYTESGTGHDSAHANTNRTRTGVGYKVATEIPLAMAASAEGDDGECIHGPESHKEAMKSPQAEQLQEVEEREDYNLVTDSFANRGVPVNQMIIDT